MTQLRSSYPDYGSMLGELLLGFNLAFAVATIANAGLAFWNTPSAQRRVRSISLDILDIMYNSTDIRIIKINISAL